MNHLINFDYFIGNAVPRKKQSSESCRSGIMAPVEPVGPVWLGSEGVPLSVLPAVASRATALAVNPVSPTPKSFLSFLFFFLCCPTVCVCVCYASLFTSAENRKKKPWRKRNENRLAASNFPSATLCFFSAPTTERTK